MSSVTLVLGALLGGFLLNLMPCVFPVLAIKVLGFVEQAGNSPRQVARHGLAYSAGVILSFWVLAIALLLLRAAGHELGWGFQMQAPAFVLVLAGVMLLFALNLCGTFEIGLRATTIGSALVTGAGYRASFFSGVLATVMATPCSAPFLVPAFASTLTLSPASSLLIFTAIGFGLSLPYLALAVFPRAVRRLPRPGRWMERFRLAMSLPLFASTSYLLWVLAAQIEPGPFIAASAALAITAAAVWMYGHVTGSAGQRWPVRVGLAATVVALSLGSFWSYSINSGAAADSAAELRWEKWSAARVVELRAEGRPIYVDFTARWCASCQANKKLVFSSTQVRQTLRKRKVVLLEADWTRQDPLITEELERWGRNAVPFNLIYLPGQAQPVTLPPLLTPSVVLQALGG